MINIKNKSLCSGCYACYNICPKQCISMVYDDEGFWYPEINRSLCINCNLCENVCPIINCEISNNNPHAYACMNKHTHERMESSSGGIFVLLAKSIIEQNGIVFGAAFDNEFNVRHVKVDNLNDLNLLKTSKYVQSKISSTFKEVHSLLEQGRLVYFSGTPCQIDGLLKYLQIDYKNLICQDIICHGVPSPEVWRNYLEARNTEYNQTPQYINFRNKRHGWKNYEITIKYGDDLYSCQHTKDPYMKAFLSDITLRPSCYDCHSKNLSRRSDITLGDFWGVNNIDKVMDDDKGTSLLLINTLKGQNLLNLIKNDITIKDVDLMKSVKYNPSAYQSAKIPYQRSKFFEDYKKKVEIITLLKQYTHVNIFKRLIKKLRILRNKQ